MPSVGGVFSTVWKKSSLRVLLKDKDNNEKNSKSHRSVCLLSVTGKLFEKLFKMLLKNLINTALTPGRISDRQFGFRASRRRTRSWSYGLYFQRKVHYGIAL